MPAVLRHTRFLGSSLIPHRVLLSNRLLSSTSSSGRDVLAKAKTAPAARKAPDTCQESCWPGGTTGTPCCRRLAVNSWSA